ncbi:MAG TPA: hypothetical protein VK035_00445 [Kiloniellales bacterium]|nr:hypothetical protein [Kiloniellales bacterium]
MRDLGLVEEVSEESPITGLLERIADIDPIKVAILTQTLQKMSIFNDVVRQQVAQMSVGERYEKITRSFDSIRDDAKSMVDQLEDNQIDLFERATNVWMKITRGDIATSADGATSVREAGSATTSS